MKNIIIVNSRIYCGGTIVLSLLCKLLQDKGINAKTLYVHEFPKEDDTFIKYWKKWFWCTLKYRIKELIYFLFKGTKLVENSKFSTFKYISIRGVKEKILPFYNKNNTIVIYPEVAFGNYLCAKNVIRYLLYYYKYRNIDKAYNKNDLFICYRHIFNDNILNPSEHELTLNFFDSNLYRQYNFKEREGNCYIIRKGRNRKDLPTQFDGPIIDFGMKENDIVEILNNSKYCYSYDTQTFYTSIAAVCGCIPIVMLESGKTRNDYLDIKENKLYGVAYGNCKEEIDYAINTRDLLIESLNYNKSNDNNILKFIELLKERF